MKNNVIPSPIITWLRWSNKEPDLSSPNSKTSPYVILDLSQSRYLSKLKSKIWIHIFSLSPPKLQWFILKISFQLKFGYSRNTKAKEPNESNNRRQVSQFVHKNRRVQRTSMKDWAQDISSDHYFHHKKYWLHA